MKKISVILSLVILVSMLVVSNPVQALPPTSISDEELAELESMTLADLEDTALPMPEEALSIDSYGDKVLNSNSKVPQDGNIYYIDTSFSGQYFKEFYQFLYFAPSTFTNGVKYHIFRWEFVDGKKYRYIEISPEIYNPELYKELVGDTTSTAPGKDEKKIYSIERIAGSSRIQTAKAIADKYNSDTVENVVLATGANFPDALAGSVLAAKLNAPILLTGNTVEASKDTLDFVSSHLDKSGRVYVLGGVGAVSEDVLDALRGMGYQNIERLAGVGRYDTSKAIVDELNPDRGTSVVIATGENFPDALSISSIAAIKGYPILLASKNALPQQTKDALLDIVPQKVYIVGGEGVVSANVQGEIKELLSLEEENVIRLSGQGRYETSLNIVNYFKLDSKNIVLATGQNFPDALAGSVLAAKLNAPILLIDNDGSEQKRYLDNSDFTNITLLGGTGAINEKVESLLKE